MLRFVKLHHQSNKFVGNVVLGIQSSSHQVCTLESENENKNFVVGLLIISINGTFMLQIDIRVLFKQTVFLFFKIESGIRNIYISHITAVFYVIWNTENCRNDVLHYSVCWNLPLHITTTYSTLTRICFSGMEIYFLP